MRPQRVLALAMIAIQAAVIEHMLFLLEWYPVAVAVLALIATPGWITIPLGRIGRIAVAAVLGLFIYAGMYTNMLTFLITHRLPVESILGGYSYAVGWYLLTLQAAILLLRTEDGRLPTYFPALGAVVIACAGASGRHGPLDPIYHLAALGFVFLMVVYWAAEPKPIPRGEHVPGNVRGRLIQGAVLLLALATSFLLSTVVGSYRREIDNAVFSVMPGLLPQTSVGFSTRARLDSVERLRAKDGDAVALRVFAKDTPGYLRGRTYDRYMDNCWDVTAAEHPLAEVGNRSGTQEALFEVRNVGEPYNALRVDPAVRSDGCLFVPLEAVYVALSGQSPIEDDNGNVKVPGNTFAAEYGVHTSATPVSGPLTEPVRSRFLAVPDPIDPGVRDLAARLFAACKTSEQKIAAVVAYFGANYTYQFGIQVPPGKDPLTYFLLEHPPAHCEYFATGAAVLLRLGGVPSRYVTGFVAAEDNGIGGYWIARNRDAHAWVEAYDDEHGAWLTVEPTIAAGVPNPDRQQRTAVLAHVTDSVRYALERLHRAIASGNWQDLLRYGVARVLRWIVSPAGLVLIAVAVGYAIFKRRGRRVRSARRVPANPNVVALTRLRRTIDRRVRRLGYKRKPEETIHAFADRIASACSIPLNPPSKGDLNGYDPAAAERLRQAVEWYRVYCEVRFRGPVTPQELDHLRARLSR